MDDKKPRIAQVNFYVELGDSIQAEWDEENQRLALKVIREGQNVSNDEEQHQPLFNRLMWICSLGI
jgi:hypothetical protein